MNDLEINIAVAKKLGVFHAVADDEVSIWVLEPSIMEIDQLAVVHADYCNNWADGGPVIEKYEISMQYNPFFGNGYWMASVQDDLVEGGKRIETTDKRLLLCAMKCFLEMDI